MYVALKGSRTVNAVRKNDNKSREMQYLISRITVKLYYPRQYSTGLNINGTESRKIPTLTTII